MSVSICSNIHRIISLPLPLPFESVILGVGAFENQLWYSEAREQVTLIFDFMGINSKKKLGRVLENLNVCANYTSVRKSWSFNYFEEYICDM